MNTATANAPLSFGDLYSAADTRSLIWFQEGDIGTARKMMLESLLSARVEAGHLEDILDDRTRARQLCEQRVGQEAEPWPILHAASRQAASLRATVVCALVGAWTAVEGQKTRPIGLLRRSLMHELGHAAMQSRRSYSVADFFKPVEYNWSETDYEADQALKTFSEQTHADY